MKPVPTRLRQIALVAEDLGKAKQLLTTVIGTEVIFEDPAVEQWGLKNFLVPIGGDFIEVVSPFIAEAPASRHLSKNGDGGYMIIMQTLDAMARRRYIESNKLAKVIFAHELEDSVCIQYHPRGIFGGMIPELDSHHNSEKHPDPLGDPFSPWHAAGPSSSYPQYRAGMEKHAHLQVVSATLQLAPEDSDTLAAAQQWHSIFGIAKALDKPVLQFTNARMTFVPGQPGYRRGLVAITIAVRRDNNMLVAILDRAMKQGLEVNGNIVTMIGVRWRFISSIGKPTGEFKSSL